MGENNPVTVMRAGVFQKEKKLSDKLDNQSELSSDALACCSDKTKSVVSVWGTSNLSACFGCKYVMTDNVLLINVHASLHVYTVTFGLNHLWH